VPEQPPENLLNLPAVPVSGEVEELVFDGEVVEEAAPGAPPPPPVRAVIVAARSVTVMVRHEHTRAVARHVAYVPAGVVVLARRRRHGRTQAQRAAHQLSLQGEHDKALLMLRQADDERHRRHERARGRAEILVLLVRNAHWITIATVGVMLGVGMAVGNAAWAFDTAAAAIRGLVTAAKWAAFAAPLVMLVALHEAGRRGDGLAPRWALAAKPGDDERGLVVTADGIVLALQHTPVSELKKAFKDGWKPVFHTLPIRDGEGYFSVFSVPLGVTPANIADQVEVFARNLHRAKTEVWPTDAERAKIAPAGHVALWVANPGVLDRAAPEWPLLHEGTADVFKGVPAGVGPRGDQLSIRVVSNNLVCGGIMGMGKSNACRVVMLGAALDPLAELQVHVFAYNGDFDAYEPRLARYVKGAEEAQLMEAMDTLHELYAEVGRREQRLSELGAKKVTRDLAQRYPDLRPRLTLFSECHVLFGDKEYGEEATELAANTMRRARKTALWIGFDTQDARKDAIPPKIVGLVSVNICFYVKTWRANDGFLGDGAFQAGIRATELRPTRDVGRSVATGVSDSQFELLKWHYIFSDDDTGQDDAAPVIARAMKSVAPGTPVASNSPVTVMEMRDLLMDLAAAVDGPGRVKLRDAVGMLRNLAPRWPRYSAMTATQLRAALDDEGVKTVNTSGTHWLDPEDVRRAIGTRRAGE
jgi:S-DNA-T family DNA segregation ATPase FtsK/SpoIIIE